LSDRRGFRYDQLGIEDVEIWAEIFEEMGGVARGLPPHPRSEDQP
jgi:hypothetical protein